MADAEEAASLTPAELRANLTEYTQQLKQVEELLLLGEGDNEEMHEMYTSLSEVIQLTQDLLREATGAGVAQQQQQTAAAAGAGPSAPPPAAAGAGAGAGAGPSAGAPAPSLLPAALAEQIRKAQIKAALQGQAPATWLIGAKLQALYSADQQFYNAVVDSATVEGNLVVTYEGYEEQAEVPLQSLKERPESNEVYMGVAAPKRKRVQEEQVITEIPKWLEIKEGDDEKTILRKKKLIKSCKSKMRFQNMDLAQKSKADNWHDFMSGKGKKKKAGFFTGRKKESMFSVPAGLNAKVGVTNSGKGMTEYQKPKPVGGLPEMDD